jgi:hypothetical protein
VCNCPKGVLTIADKTFADFKKSTSNPTPTPDSGSGRMIDTKSVVATVILVVISGAAF